MSNTTLRSGALTLATVNGLKNPELKECVIKMINANVSINEGVWTYAINANNVIVNSYFNDDYGTLTAFAKAMDIPKSTMSKYSNAVQLMAVLTDNYGYSVEVMPITKVMELLPVKDEIADFMDYIEMRDVQRMPRDEIRKLVKEYRNKDKEQEQEQEQEEEETIEVEETVIVKCIEDKDGLHIFYNENEYLLPFEKLNKFIVKA